MGASAYYSQGDHQSSKAFEMDGLDFFNSRTSQQNATSETVVLDRTYGTRIQPERPCLLLMSAEGKVLATQPLNRTITLIGRSKRNHIQIDDPTVSVTHLSVSASDNEFIADDLGSCNGSFINGQRLIDRKVLNDGDTIQLGTTTIQFAAGLAAMKHFPDSPHGSTPSRNVLKRHYAWAIILCCLVIGSVVIIISTWPLFNPLTATETAANLQEARSYPQGEAADASETYLSPHPAQRPAQIIDHDPANARSDQLPPLRGPSDQPQCIQQALAYYMSGQLKEAIHILDTPSASWGQGTPSEHLQVKRLLSMFNTIQELYDRAILAQTQRNFSEAIECWDRLLTLDVELIGDRPSYFCNQAKTKVQPLFYNYAVEAMRNNNPQKAGQLCQAILTINPNHFDALMMLSKINQSDAVVN